MFEVLPNFEAKN